MLKLSEHCVNKYTIYSQFSLFAVAMLDKDPMNTNSANTKPLLLRGMQG